ncbi:VirB4-like conjugal transfer ATPase, CD1110 family [Senegalia sp. (in: firmicutes)]|uniref:VirB4-like conjugal transfer ATPase, CD1110 family n=1 Tax=Senegalia sp. (in: firmicutes) TaxID=1924098 RepID=UPI003F9533E6
MDQRKNLFQRMKQTIEYKKNNVKIKTTQETLNFDKVFSNGIIKLNNNTYSKSLRFSDVGYQLAKDEDKTRVFTLYCSLLNWFDPEINFQFSFINYKIEQEAYKDKSTIDTKNTRLKKLQDEYFNFVKTQREKGNNGIIRNKYITFTIKDPTYENAVRRLETITKNVRDRFKRLGVSTYSLNGIERLAVINNFINNNEENYFDVEKLSNDIFDKNLEKDYIAPKVIDFNIKNKNQFRLGKRIGTTMYFNITSSKLADRVLVDFLELQKELLISIHMRSMDQQKTISMMKRKSSDLDAIKIKEQQKAIQRGYDMDLMPTDLDPNRKDVTKLLENLQSEDERYFYITFTITVLDETQEELDNTIYQLKALAQNNNCEMLDFKNQQEKAFLSALPIGNNLNEIEYERGLNTTATAIFVPFTTQELYQEENDPVYYGLNALSNNLIQVSRKSLKTPNGLFLGTPGSGKSFSAKREMIDTFLTTQDDIIITDPEGEYGNFVRQLEGQEIIISLDSDKYINPLDINDEYGGDENSDPIRYKSDFVTNMMNIIVGTKYGLTGKEKSLTDKAVRIAYRPYLDSKGDPNSIPMLEDIYNIFLDFTDPEAKGLADALELYVKGSLNVFNNHTTIDIKNRLISFNIQHLGSNLKDLGMLVLQDHVWNRVTKNRHRNITTWYYMDEFHVLLADERTSGYSVDFWKRFRKYGGIPSGITQNVKDLLCSQKIETILENSDFIYLLNQAWGDRSVLQEKLNISDYQANYITNSEEGEGLIVFNGEILPFKDNFPKNNSLYPVMTTKPEEIAKYKKQNLLPNS